MHAEKMEDTKESGGSASARGRARAVKVHLVCVK